MRTFHKISPLVWRSRRFGNLPDDRTRQVFLFLLCGPHQKSSGCQYLPPKFASAELRMSERVIIQALQVIEASGLIDVDWENECIYVDQWFTHNPPTNRKHLKGIVRELKTLPSDRLRTRAATEAEAVFDAQSRKKAEEVNERLKEKAYQEGSRRAQATMAQNGAGFYANSDSDRPH